MSDEDDSLSRRALLGQLGVVGVTGLAVGAGTSAVVNDAESFPGNAIQSRRLDLGVAYETAAGSPPQRPPSSFPSEFEDTDAVTVPFDDLETGTSAAVTMALEATPCGRRVELWMRVTGTGLDSELASLLGLDVTVADECGSDDRVSLLDDSAEDDSLAAAVRGTESREGLRAGVPLRNDCSGSDDGECPPAVCVEATIRVPEPDEKIRASVRDQSVSLTFEFVARQCAGDRTRGGSPWNE